MAPQNRGRLVICIALACLIALSPSYVSGAQGHLSIGSPDAPGTNTVDVYVHFPGVFPGLGADSNGNVLVHVTGIKGNGDSQAKANAIAAAINKAFNTDVATVAQTAGGSYQVNLSYNKNGTPIAGNAWIPKNGDKTGEGAALASLDVVPSNFAMIGLMGFDTGLSGMDMNGNASTFTAEFGYDGLNDTVTLAYNQLTTPTLDGLVSQMFADLLAGLPAGLQGDLSLDLADDAILFDLPVNQTNYFAGTLSTDTEVETYGGLETAPEPSAFLLICVGLAVISRAIRMRRPRRL